MSDFIDSSLLREAETGAELEALPTASNQMRIWCGICYRFKMGKNPIDRPSANYVSELMEEGVMLHEAHATNRNHIYAIANLEEEYGFKRRKPVIEAIQENLPPSGRHFISTENLFRLAVEHIQHNVAFRLWQSKLKTSSL
jgi:hypothetical protein